ncbi:MAG: hypothetical protein QY325_07735 [Flavobacteriales bacterium]|nr:MAG: hypothetical protein QY325_07735 [Flavobacteriales bacterium]
MRRLVLLMVLVGSVLPAEAQAIKRRHLVTRLGFGAGIATVNRTPDSLAVGATACGSLAFGFGYATGNRWSFGFLFDRIGADQPAPAAERIRFTTYQVEVAYRPWIGDRSAVELSLALGPMVMALKPYDANLPLVSNRGSTRLSVRYLRMLTGTIAVFGELAQNWSGPGNVVDYEGRALLNSAGEPLLLAWNSQRINAGLAMRF